jgi:hypothetical protein
METHVTANSSILLLTTVATILHCDNNPPQAQQVAKEQVVLR